MDAHSKKSADKTSALKIPPHSIEAEQSVLGGIMLDNQAWDQVIEIVVEEDFYRQEHRLIFQALQRLARQNFPQDVLTLSEDLKKHDQLANTGGESYLFELAKNTPSASNVTAYAEIVHERSVLRQLIGVANHIAESAYYPKGRASGDLLDEAESRVFKIAEQRDKGNGPLALSHHLATAVERIDTLFHSGNAITGLSTGFDDLDKMTSGLQASDLVIIAGRPSMGKTTFAMNIAETAALEIDKPVLVFSMEMPGDSLAMRMLSSLGRIEQHRIRSGQLQDDDFPRLMSATALLNEKAKMFIDDTPGLNPTELRAKARRVAKAHGQLGLIVIDYLQLMQVPGFRENRTAEISEISRSLKSLARELNTPVIALSQLNRSLEQRTDKRPVMSDLRESGAIEQDADVIMFIYRDEVYHEDSPDKGKAEIIIAKQRNGPIGKLHLAFLGRYTRFENFTQEMSPN